MNHQRHIIREAIVALLAAAGTPAGSRVYDTPWDPRTVFPALTVEEDGEEQQLDNFGSTMGNRYVTRTMRLIVNAEVQQVSGYARTRDQLLAAVEAALATSAIAGVKSITPSGYRADLGMVGERPIALGRQRFDVVYQTTQANPSISV
jgi:hypothetical protein